MQDAERRNQERLADEAKAAKDKQDKYNAAMAKIKEQTDSATATAATDMRRKSPN